LIRRVLSPEEKKEVQPQLQRAYTRNVEGFYVNAPKRSRTNVKKILQYISRYMKRGPIALNRIIMYDGDIVMFRYHDKRTKYRRNRNYACERVYSSFNKTHPR
jgi:hypothetical protein